MTNSMYCVVRIDRGDLKRLPVAPLITLEPGDSDSAAVAQALHELAARFLPGVDAQRADSGLVRVTVNANAPSEARVVTIDLRRWERNRRLLLAVAVLLSLLSGLVIGHFA